MTTSQRMLFFSDGGARGNPGPAAIAFTALNERLETIKVDMRFIGIRTNNQAEYEALIMALTFAAEQKIQKLICHLDSELVVKQLNGEYSVRNPQLKNLWQKIESLKLGFKKIIFVNVPREHPQIQRVDSLVNRILDSQDEKQLFQERIFEGSMFVHTSVRTSNLERSIDFYSRILGLKLLSRQEIKKTNAEIAFLQDVECKGCKLELSFYRNQTNFSQPEYEQRLFDHLGFEVKDIQKTIEFMRSENITIADEPFALNDHTTIAFIEDPDGTLIELIERK